MELSPTSRTTAQHIRRPTMMPPRNTADAVLGLPDWEPRGRTLHRAGSSRASHGERPASLLATSTEHYEADPDLLFGDPEGAYCLHIEDQDAKALQRQGKRSQLSRRQGSDVLGEEQEQEPEQAESGTSLIRRMSGSVAKFGATVKQRMGSLSNGWRKDSGAPVLTGISGTNYVVIANSNEPGHGDGEPLPSRRGASLTAARMFASQTGASDGSSRASGPTAPLLPQTEPFPDLADSDQASPPDLTPSRRASLNRLSKNHARAIQYHAKKGSFSQKNRGKWFEGALGQDPNPVKQRRASELLRQQTIDYQKKRDEAFRRLMDCEEDGPLESSGMKDGIKAFTRRFRAKTTAGISDAASQQSSSRQSGSKSIPLARQASGPALQGESMASFEAAGQGLMRMHSAW